MTERITAFFPAEFTGIAQWLICTIFILCNEKRVHGWKAAVLIISMLPILLLMNLSHSEQPALIWLLITACCLLTMMLYLRLGIRTKLTNIVLLWSHALMQSEFAAALAWLVNAWMISIGRVSFPDIRSSQTIMLMVFIVVFVPISFLAYRSAHRKKRTVYNEYGTAALYIAIALGAYLLSNISFMAPDSIFGLNMGGGVLLVRTIADFSGALALIAIESYSNATSLRVDMGVMQNLLDRQYEQYQQFKVNNEQIQQVYHDVKHLITYIRSVSSSQKYEKALREMEETVSNYEVQYNTGNAVLDVVLSSKKFLCLSRRITMECFIDAREMDFIDPMHICSIFGNAIDNAIEYEQLVGEEEKRLIRINVFAENRFLVIHISNYCEQRVLTSSADPETTKQNPSMHGYGIKGIRLAVEQYKGHMNIRQENNWFIVSILIPLPDLTGENDARRKEGASTEGAELP